MRHEFLKNRSIILYRGIVPARYCWGFNEKDEEEIVEVIIVEKDNSIESDIFIKMSKDGEFVQLYTNGMSNHGIYYSITATNPFKKGYSDVFLKYEDKNMLVTLSTQGSIDFCFMKNVEKIEVSNNEKDYEYFDKYGFKLYPKNVYTLSYASHEINNKDIFYVCYFPSYFPSYENHIFKKINLKNETVEDYEIKDFQRYRDGGTTEINVVDKDGNGYNFYYPSPFNKGISPTFDDIELSLTPRNDSEEYEKLVQVVESCLKIDGTFKYK